VRTFQTAPDVEQNVQYSATITYQTPLIFYSTDGTFVDWIEYLPMQPSIPQTITVLYGFPEDTLPEGLVRNVCQRFAYLGVLGVSVLVASGDDGVGGGDTSGNVRFLPTFPSTYTGASKAVLPPHHALAGPWVTSVGGTMNHDPNPEHVPARRGGNVTQRVVQPAQE
jgi:tripeptidyl-peptidase-1